MENEELYLYIQEDDLYKLNGNIQEITDKKLNEVYGENISVSMKERYEYELKCILNNKFQSIYLLLYMITKKAKEDGRVAILRGPMGSALIAYLLGISYIDPIKYNIPFEVLGGINGDKTPYFDLVFSCEYANTIYKYVKAIFKGNNIVYSKEGNIRDFKTLKINFLKNSNISILENLEKVTGVNHNAIDIEDKNILNLFKEDINIIEYLIEFEGEQARNIIDKIKPKNINSLIKIYSLLHGTNVWESNVENLIQKHNIEEIACSRDDIYLYLLEKGIDRETAFEIMEFVRKGKANQLSKISEYSINKWNNYVDIMKNNNISEWYINSLGKISYMFQKAHSTHYTIFSLWLAWYKIYYPKEFAKETAI